MLHFGMSALAGPLQLLRLFPSLAPPKLLAAAAAEQAAADAAQQQQQQQRGQRDQQPGAGAQPAGQEQQGQQDGEAVAEPQGAAFVGAVQVLMPYLLSHRSRLAATAGSPAQKRAGAAGDADSSSGSGGGGGAQQGTPRVAAGAAAAGGGPSPASRATLVQQRLEGNATAALLDTALLLSLLAMPDSGALLRCGGSCVGGPCRVFRLTQFSSQRTAAVTAAGCLAAQPSPAQPTSPSPRCRVWPQVCAEAKQH